MSAHRPPVSTPDRRALGLPVAIGAACCAGIGLLTRFDPATTSWYPRCPVQATTGWSCPGCGLTRAAGQLVRGDLAAAFGAHQLWPLVAVLIAGGWWAMVQSSRRRPVPALWRSWRPAWTVALVTIVTAFTFARNLG